MHRRNSATAMLSPLTGSLLRIVHLPTVARFLLSLAGAKILIGQKSLQIEHEGERVGVARRSDSNFWGSIAWLDCPVQSNSYRAFDRRSSQSWEAGIRFDRSPACAAILAAITPKYMSSGWGSDKCSAAVTAQRKSAPALAASVAPMALVMWS
jgi:hypothetical protein